jgi:hypothetical protein
MLRTEMASTKVRKGLELSSGTSTLGNGDVRPMEVSDLALIDCWPTSLECNLSETWSHSRGGTGAVIADGKSLSCRGIVQAVSESEALSSYDTAKLCSSNATELGCRLSDICNCYTTSAIESVPGETALSLDFGPIISAPDMLHDVHGLPLIHAKAYF